jgi:hypothetical protein
VLGLGVGYVLGARAGRERYEQIRSAWNRFTGNPAVQHAAERGKEVAQVGARKSMHAVQGGVEKAAGAVKERLHGAQHGDGERTGETPLPPSAATQ